MKCSKCGREMHQSLIIKEAYFITTIWRCSNLRCGYMCRDLKVNTEGIIGRR